ncbi:MAG TPA: uroporphyrinogen decarboxylase family protein [Candidatus Aminicenantes bacterium]|nr:uroporphyrinogen decarboxylase family protein [Candidatus Aminicenantes bacterium]HRY64734.1 uroporphyrinogen decarboxylase family protein [Candidatus Aminicenantes bacterium]HRZ71647.1 uroporphyrinogen decarboxylase family protein [Candidatus Aminicenantes bacterium]
MTSRERLGAALEHRQPDRIPVDFNGTGVTGMHVKCVIGLRRHYGLPDRLVKVHEPYQMLGWIDEDLQTVLGIDVQGVYGLDTMFGYRNENWTPWRMDDGTEVLMSGNFRTTRDANGDTLVFPGGDRTAAPSGRLPRNGFFFDTIIRQEPIDEARLDPEDNLQEFGPVSDEVLGHFERESRRAAATGRGTIASFGGTALGDIALVPGPGLKRPRGVRDVEEWYVSTLTRRPYVHRVFERQTEIALANLARIRERVGDEVQAAFVCGTDFGTQRSQFCSEASFRELYLPYYRRINDWIHAHTAWKSFKHSCGAVYNLIPAFIDSGFDILNPIQVSAAGMDPRRLKQEFGRDLVFWGGGIDTQKTLAFGGPEEVRAEVLERCDIFGRDGGFVFNAVHNIQADVPVANIAAMFEAVRSHGGGR